MKDIKNMTIEEIEDHLHARINERTKKVSLSIVVPDSKYCMHHTGETANCDYYEVNNSMNHCELYYILNINDEQERKISIYGVLKPERCLSLLPVPSEVSKSKPKVNIPDFANPFDHYKWIDNNAESFFDAIGISPNQYNINSLLTSQGDKCYQYEYVWEDAGIHFYHGVLLYILSSIFPYSETCRYGNGDIEFVDPCDWVIDMYKCFKSTLPKI